MHLIASLCPVRVLLHFPSKATASVSLLADTPISNLIIGYNHGNEVSDALQLIMTTTSWTVEGAVNTPVHHGYKAYHKTHFADPQVSAPNNQRDKAVPPIRQEAASRAFHRDPDATQK